MACSVCPDIVLLHRRGTSAVSLSIRSPLLKSRTRASRDGAGSALESRIGKRLAGPPAAFSAKGGRSVPALVANCAAHKRLRSLAVPQSASARARAQSANLQSASESGVRGRSQPIASRCRAAPSAVSGESAASPIPEQHLNVGRGWSEFSVRADLRYRPGRIKSVSSRTSSGTRDSHPDGRRSRHPFISIRLPHRTKGGDVKPTTGVHCASLAAKGEALRSAQAGARTSRRRRRSPGRPRTTGPTTRKASSWAGGSPAVPGQR